MIIGQYVTTVPDRDVGEVSTALRTVARYYGVTKPLIGKQVVTPEMATSLNLPYPADLWTWKGEVNLLALPHHVIGSSPQSFVLDGPSQ